MAGELFIIDILDSGVIEDAGPLYNILSVEVTEELDKAGQVVIAVPAVDERAIALITNEKQVNVITVNGTVGRGIIQDFGITAQGNKSQFQLMGTDLLGELNYLNTGYNRRYVGNNVATEIIGTDATSYSLLGDTSWTQGSVIIDGSVTNQTIQYNAETRLSALIAMAAQIGHHLRQGSTARTLDFGVFGADSGFRILNVARFVAGIEDDTLQGYASTIMLSTISADIENKMFPLGKNKFDMRDADAAITDILVRTSQGWRGFSTTADGNTSAATIPVTATTDGTRFFRVGAGMWIGDADDWTQDHEYGVIESVSAGVSITLTADLINSYSAGADVIQRPQFYVENAASIAAYGIRENCPQFAWIGPGTTSVDSTEQEEAAESLYRAVQARMTRFKDPYKAYALGDVFNLPPTLRVGQKVHLDYRGMTADGTAYISEDDDFYVMKITRRWDGSGRGGSKGIAMLDIANVSRPAPNNQNLILYNLDNGKWIGL